MLPFQPILLKPKLTIDEISDLKLFILENPGLSIQKNFIESTCSQTRVLRFWAMWVLLTNVNLKESTLKLGSLIGKRGLEAIWDSKIRGKKGTYFREVNAKGYELSEGSLIKYFNIKSIPPEPGLDVVLTIDEEIQKKAFQAMNRKDAIGPRNGALVAMKKNGEIIAWISSPSFDPNEFSSGISDEVWQSLLKNKSNPLRNKVIQDHFSPGSTMKPFVALAALQENIISKETKISAPGSIFYKGRRYHDHLRRGHGIVNVTEAIERSSNVFFYKMGMQLEIEKLAH